MTAGDGRMARRVFRLAWAPRPAPPEPLTILDQKLVGGQPAVGGEPAIRTGRARERAGSGGRRDRARGPGPHPARRIGVGQPLEAR
jgi:hypothetical protein